MRIERISGAILILLSGVLLLMAAYLSRGYIREVVIDIGRSALSSN